MRLYDPGVRVLHVGSGFRPMRKGGLVAYIEDLMGAQVAVGDEVAYFFSGRFYPFVNGPRLRRWQRAGVSMLEVVNSPLHDHGRQPQLELAEPRIERLFDTVLGSVDPDVVHFQELAGLPSSLLEVARERGFPTVLTLQDYYPLCPIFKLLDAEGRVCLRRDIGEECVATTAALPSYPGLLYKATLTHDIPRLPLIRRVRSAKVAAGIDRLAAALAGRATSSPPAVGSAADFQARRDVNVERLSGIDVLIAMSHRVAEIYAQLGVDRSHLRTMQLTLDHIHALTPRRATGEAPLTLATLGGLESEAKGARVLLDAMSQLQSEVRDGRLRLIAFGYAHLSIRAEAERTPGLELPGPFAPSELDRILDEVDVGIMPSVWEEAFGYAGMEFLAKGIPVISNDIGGMPDYTREGETGWLNRSCSADGLARLMRAVSQDPEQIVALNAKLRANRDSIVKPMARHAREMDAVYGELVG